MLTKYYVGNKEFTDIKEAEKYEAQLAKERADKEAKEKEMEERTEIIKDMLDELEEALADFEDDFGRLPNIKVEDEDNGFKFEIGNDFTDNDFLSDLFEVFDMFPNHKCKHRR